MGKSQRNKGCAHEQDIVRRFKAAGIDAVRVPMSGAIEGFPGDVLIGPTNYRWRVEVKFRTGSGGDTMIRKWLEGNDLLITKSPHKEPLVTMELSTFYGLFKDALGENGEDNTT